MVLHLGKSNEADGRGLSVNPFYGEADPVAGMAVSPPRHRLPDNAMSPATAHQIVLDELRRSATSGC